MGVTHITTTTDSPLSSTLQTLVDVSSSYKSDPLRVGPVVLFVFSLVMVVVAHLLPDRYRNNTKGEGNKMA